MQLVNEQQNLPVALLNLGQHGFQALLKFTAELGARDEGAHVQGKDAAFFQVVRHVAAHDALGQAFGDGGLAHAGLANQHRVVLGLAAQDADDITDFAVTPDDRVQLLVARQQGQVAAVLGQRVIAVLGRVAGDPGRAAHLGQGF